MTSVIRAIDMTFDNKSAVETFIKKYKSDVKKVFTITNSKVFAKDNPLYKSLYWKEVKYACKHGGTKYRDESTGVRDSRYIDNFSK